MFSFSFFLLFILMCVRCNWKWKRKDRERNEWKINSKPVKMKANLSIISLTYDLIDWLTLLWTLAPHSLITIKSIYVRFDRYVWETTDMAIALIERTHQSIKYTYFFFYITQLDYIAYQWKPFRFSFCLLFFFS